MGSSLCSKQKSQNKQKSTLPGNKHPILNRENSFDIDSDIELYQNNRKNNQILNMSTNKSKKRKLENESSDSEPAKKKQKKTPKKDDEEMTRNEFFKYAKNQIAICGDVKLAVKKKKNSTGSVGFTSSEHVIIPLNNDKKVAVIFGLNATVIGSKKWNDGDELSDDEDDDLENDEKKDKKKPEKGDIMTKSEFLSIAEDLKLEMFDQEFTLKPKKTKSGSVGWGVAGLKIKTEINDIPLRLQTSVNVTCKKSKDWDEGETKEE